MPIPTSIDDLQPLPEDNFPQGTDTPDVIDNVLREHAAYIAQLRDDFASDSVRTDLATTGAGKGAEMVAFKQAGVGAVDRTSSAKLRETVTPEDFGAVGDGVTDDTAAVQATINTNKSVDFADANYLVGPLTIPATAAGATYRGAGFWHYGKTRKTRFTARDTGQAHIFKLANGADNISFELMRLDCEDKCAKGIDGEFGAFLSLDAVGVYGATEWGIYNKQGLARWRRLFVRCDNATGGGAHLYSDGSIESSEFTRGRVPLKLAAGGNRLVNVWANGGTECCLELAPFDTATNHINTSITGLYAGETLGGATEKPIIKIAGNATRRVEQVQITASHLVCAETAIDKINIAVDATYARDVAINGLTVLGFNAPTATRQLQHFVRADNTLNLSISGNVVRHCTKNLIVIGANCYPVNIADNTFSEYATAVAAGTEGAAILIDNTTSYGAITGNIFDISGASTVPYAAEGGSATRWVFDDNLIRYTSSNVWNPSTGTVSGTFKRLGSSSTLNNVNLTNTTIGNTNVNNAKQNFQSRGQVSAGASSTTTLTTLSNVAENQSYLITVRQSGSGANSVAAYVMAFNSSTGAVRIAQSNTNAALDMNITMSGLSIQLVLGSGYGTTTWDWVITRLG